MNTPNTPTHVSAASDLAEQVQRVMIRGDLSKLNAEEAISYYYAVCNSIGLNPLTKPFEYIVLNGKLQLYALKGATDQLRRLYNISIEILDRTIRDQILTVHVRARDGTGRVDEDVGVVPLSEKLMGEVRANTIMKCVTKAKRRVTLSICGLGMLDETEIDAIPDRAKVAAPAEFTPIPENGKGEKQP